MNRISIDQKKIVHESTGHENTVTGIAVSHTNLETYTVSGDKTIKIWK
jgi:WD40 repeat protein